MSTYTLKVEGPKATDLHVSAHDDDGAISLIKQTVAADFAGERDPLVLQSRVTLTSRDTTIFEDTVETILATRPPDGSWPSTR